MQAFSDNLAKLIAILGVAVDPDIEEALGHQRPALVEAVCDANLI